MLLLNAADHVLAHTPLPAEHPGPIQSTNALGCLKRQLARRSDVVGIFPNVRSLTPPGAMLGRNSTTISTQDARKVWDSTGTTSGTITRGILMGVASFGG